MKKNQTANFIDEVEDETKGFYGGTLDAKAMQTLFPDIKSGCINFGFWEVIPDYISLEDRLNSEISLYKKIFEYSDIIPGQVVAEIGAGRGHGINLLSKEYGCEAIGIDAVQEQVLRSRSNYPDLQDCFIWGTAEKTGLLDKSIDRVISVEVAQHIPDFGAYAKESYRILKQGGKLITSTFFFPHKKAQSRIGEILPSGFEGYHHAITIGEAYKELSTAGFTTISPFSIGNKVFEGFSKWAKQEQKIPTHSSRWIDAYRSGMLDYYIIVADK